MKNTGYVNIYLKVLISVCFFLLLALWNEFLEVSFAAAEPASFLLIGVGARPLGMGGAFTALADESSTIYWNPAGLSLLKKREISGMYGSLFKDTSYSFVSYAQTFSGHRDKPAGEKKKKEKSKMAVGVGWLQLRCLGIEKTDQNKSLGNTRMINDAFFVSGSIKPFYTFPLYLGITGKRISQEIDTFSSTGFGVDLGMLLDGGILTWGVNVQNVGKTQIKGTSYWGDNKVKELIPCHIRSGLALKVKKVFFSLVNLFEKTSPGAEYSIYEPRISQNPQALEHKKLSLQQRKSEPVDIEINVAFDFDFVPQTTDPFKIYQGVECWLNKIYGLRVSFVDGFSGGGSLRFEHFKIDYVFILHTKLEDTHRFSLTAMF